MHSCGALQLRGDSFDVNCFGSEIFVGLTKRLRGGILPVFYPKGGLFFLEGQPVRGVFLLRAGRVKELLASNTGKTAIVRVVGPGELLGLSAVLGGGVHETSAEALQPTNADFVGKGAFLHVLKTSGQLSQMVASQLSRHCTEAYDSIRCLGLSASVSERVARLLLHWAEYPLGNSALNTLEIRIRVTLTHEEIAQFVGSTRETISRTVKELRQKKWLRTDGSVWTIANEGALRRLAAL